MTDFILQAVRGENLFNRPRWPSPVQADPAYAQVVEEILEPNVNSRLALERWLRQRAAGSFLWAGWAQEFTVEGEWIYICR